MKNFHDPPSLDSLSSLFLLFQTQAGMSMRAIGSVLMTTATDPAGSFWTNFSVSMTTIGHEYPLRSATFSSEAVALPSCLAGDWGEDHSIVVEQVRAHPDEQERYHPVELGSERRRPDGEGSLPLRDEDGGQYERDALA